MTEQLPVIIDNILEFLLDPDTLEKLAEAGFKLFLQLTFGIPRMLPQLATALGKIIKSIFSHLAEPAKEIFSNIWQNLVNTFSGVGSWFGEKFTAAKNAIKNAFSSIGDWFSDRWDDIKEVFTSIPQWFGSKFQEAWSAIKNAFSGVGQWFSDLWSDLKQTFVDIGTAVGDAVSSGFKTAWNFVIDTVEDIANILPDAINGVTGWINDFFDTDIGQVDRFDFSGAKLAKGGIVDRATPAIVGEAGKEAIIPLENNKNGLKYIASLLSDEMQTKAVYNFTQNNNSPKSLSRWEIYRQTRNLLNAAKVGV